MLVNGEQNYEMQKGTSVTNAAENHFKQHCTAAVTSANKHYQQTYGRCVSSPTATKHNYSTFYCNPNRHRDCERS